MSLNGLFRLIISQSVTPKLQHTMLNGHSISIRSTDGRNKQPGRGETHKDCVQTPPFSSKAKAGSNTPVNIGFHDVLYLNVAILIFQSVQQFRCSIVSCPYHTCKVTLPVSLVGVIDHVREVAGLAWGGDDTLSLLLSVWQKVYSVKAILEKEGGDISGASVA